MPLANKVSAAACGSELPAGSSEGREAALVAMAKGGDLGAYEELVQANVRRLRAYLALRAPASMALARGRRAAGRDDRSMRWGSVSPESEAS